MPAEFDNPALQRLKDVFNIVAAPPTPSLTDALSPSTLSQAAEDIYALMQRPDAKENITLLLNSFSKQELTSIVDNIKAELMTPQTAQNLARSLRKNFEDLGPEHLTVAMQDMMENRSPQERMMMTMMLTQVMPLIPTLQQLSEPQLAGLVVRMAAKVPTQTVVEKLSEFSGGGSAPRKRGPKGSFDI